MHFSQRKSYYFYSPTFVQWTPKVIAIRMNSHWLLTSCCTTLLTLLLRIVHLLTIQSKWPFLLSRREKYLHPVLPSFTLLFSIVVLAGSFLCNTIYCNVPFGAHKVWQVHFYLNWTTQTPQDYCRIQLCTVTDGTHRFSLPLCSTTIQCIQDTLSGTHQQFIIIRT